jgi:hypothetical protein
MNSRRLIAFLKTYRTSYRQKLMRWKGKEMSALGQKRTFAAQKAMSALPPNSDRESGPPQTVMSALPPKADMCSAVADVCNGPIADKGRAKAIQLELTLSQTLRPVTFEQISFANTVEIFRAQRDASECVPI